MARPGASRAVRKLFSPSSAMLAIFFLAVPATALVKRAPWDGVIGGMAEAVQEPVTPCSCDCCQVGRRTPAELAVGATQLKCIASGDMPAAAGVDELAVAESLECPASCGLGLRAKVMTNIESDSVLYSQFCFLECRPFDIKLGSHCVGITTAEADMAATRDGTGQDIHVIPVVQQPPAVPPPLPPPLADKLLDGMDGGASMSAPPIQPTPPEPSPAEKSLKEGDDATAAADALQAELDAQAKAAKGHADESEKMAGATQEELKDFPKLPFLVQKGQK